MGDQIPDERAAKIRRIFASNTVVQEDLKGFDGGITMMPNNICNANCIFCAYQYNTEPKQTMTLELFKHGLDSTMKLGSIAWLVFTPVAGEPLADPTLFDKMAYARQRGPSNMIVTTNGILLRQNDNFKRLIDAGLHTIHISSPGLDPGAYERLYRSKRYEAVMDGLLKLLAYKEERRARVMVKLLLRLDRPIEDAMQEPGMKLIAPYLERGTIVLDDIINNYDNWSGHITEDQLIGNMTVSPAKEKPIPCHRMLHDLAMLPDGKVRVCSCRYYETNHDELVIGDVTEKPMADILFGERHQRLLADVAAGRWPRACQTCSLYQAVVIEDEDVDRMARKADEIQAARLARRFGVQSHS